MSCAFLFFSPFPRHLPLFCNFNKKLYVFFSYTHLKGKQLVFCFNFVGGLIFKTSSAMWFKSRHFLEATGVVVVVVVVLGKLALTLQLQQKCWWICYICYLTKTKKGREWKSWYLFPIWILTQTEQEEKPAGLTSRWWGWLWLRTTEHHPRAEPHVNCSEGWKGLLCKRSLFFSIWNAYLKVTSTYGMVPKLMQEMPHSYHVLYSVSKSEIRNQNDQSKPATSWCFYNAFWTGYHITLTNVTWKGSISVLKKIKPNSACFWSWWEL